MQFNGLKFTWVPPDRVMIDEKSNVPLIFGAAIQPCRFQCYPKSAKIKYYGIQILWKRELACDRFKIEDVDYHLEAKSKSSQDISYFGCHSSVFHHGISASFE